MMENNSLEKKPETEALYTEKGLEQDLYQKGRDSALAEMNLPESAERKMERLENAVNELASLASQLSPELYSKDREKFEELNNQVQQKLAEIEVLMVTFETTINLEYPKVPMFQKLAMLLISLTRSNIKESTLIQTFGGNEPKKDSLINALKEFKKLHEQYKNKIEEAKNAPYKISQQEILKSNSEYKALLQRQDNAKRDIEIVSKYIGGDRDKVGEIWKRWNSTLPPTYNNELKLQLEAILEAELNKVKQQIERLEKEALFEVQKKENGK